jgi:hypothetical protein
MFQRRIVNNATLDSTDSAEVVKALEAASRRIDEKCYRHFYAKTDTRVLAGNGCNTLRIPDLLAATSIKLDEDGNRTFELVLVAATDYYLERWGHDDIDALPATRIRLDSVNGQRSAFLARERLLQIIGIWGYTEETEAVEASGVAVTGTLSNAADLTLATSADGDLAVGQTLKLEDEQVYISSGTTSPFTVVRAQNGTTAAAHSAVAVNRYVYVPEIREAALILASRAWKRRESAYANVVDNPVVGSYAIFKQYDPDVEALLAPFIRGDKVL